MKMNENTAIVLIIVAMFLFFGAVIMNDAYVSAAEKCYEAAKVNHNLKCN